MGQMKQQQYEDPVFRLHKAHATIAQVLSQIDGLVLKAHRMSAHKQIGGLDLCNFSRFLETTAFSLQEWISRFEDATPGVCTEDQVHPFDGYPTSVQEMDVPDNEFRKRESVLCMQSENLPESLLDVDVLLVDDQNNVLGSSPLVPWLVAKPKKAVPHSIPSRRSFKEQASLETASQARALHSRAGIIPVNLSPSLDTCAEIMQVAPAPVTPSSMLSCNPCMNEQEHITGTSLVSAASTPARLVQRHSIEDLESINIVTQSLLKRYSNFYEADDHFSHSSPMPLITPDVKHRKVLLYGLTPMVEECMEITDYFTAFSPPRSLAPSIFHSKASPCSLVSVNSSPEDKAGGTMQHVCHEGFSNVVEHSTPLPPQSLMKRYPQFLHIQEEEVETVDPNVTLSHMLMRSPPKTCILIQSNNTEEERDEVADSTATLTRVLMSSPPKTCIVMGPNRIENSAWSRKSLQTSRLPRKSPFRTPGPESIKQITNPFYEEMDLTSLKKPGQPPRHPDSVKMTPSSDMQFATMKKTLGSVNQTPFVDLQLSTVRKPGVPLPGEQTLKRELWSRMEAELTSMAHVCKTLFTDSQTEAAVNPEAGAENRQPKGKLAAPE